MKRIVTAQLCDVRTFGVTTRSDQNFTVRAGADSADDPGPAPMELLLTALATCSGATMESILAKMRLQVDDLVVAVDAVRADKPPRVWTDVRLRYLIRGNVPVDRAEHAAKLAERTCDASVMLEKATNLSHQAFVVNRVGEQATVTVRHSVLRTGLPPESVVIHGDADAAWFGAWYLGDLVGTAGVFEEPSPEADSTHRLRAMATTDQVRGFGLGAMLLDAAIDHARAVGAASLWCSARTPAAGIYIKRGFVFSSDEYEVEGIGPHVRMRLDLGSG